MDLKRQKINIVGVGVDDVSEKQAVESILALSGDRLRHHYAVTVNSEFVMMAHRNRDFAQVIEESDLSLPDGVGVVVSKLIAGGREKNRVTGVDLIEKICAKSQGQVIRVGFLGGFHRVAEIVAKRQVERFPELKVVFCQEGSPTIGQDLKLRRAINAVGGIDVLFVAYGMGQQEFWIKRNIKSLDVGIAIGVGGAFDYLAKIKVRAPFLVQKLGLEWSWRLANEPWRIKRMRVLPVFLVLVAKQWVLQNVQNIFKR